MDRLYAAADVLLLPSEDEPFGLVILEAMAAGVPVVASRSGGIPEIVEHGKSGRLVEPGDVDGFASALREVLTQRELRDSLVEEGRKLVEGHFSLKRFVDEVVEVYDEVLGLRPGVSADAASGNGTASSRSSTAGPPQ
jgi:glycosyltransferase involved in cell wall biosynthesis